LIPLFAQKHKGTYEYRFINVPQAQASLDLVRDCAALDCAVVAIQP
jgi:hypothetical protein